MPAERAHHCHADLSLKREMERVGRDGFNKRDIISYVTNRVANRMYTRLKRGMEEIKSTRVSACLVLEANGDCCNESLPSDASCDPRACRRCETSTGRIS